MWILSRLALLLGILLTGWGGWQAIGVCASSILALAGRGQGDANPVAASALVEKSIGWQPDNPETHLAKASLLLKQQKHESVQEEMSKVARLLPRDYFTWLETGLARERAGDATGAITALRQAKQLAPHYSDVAWQLGNILLRAGQAEEGLAELNRAAAVNSSLWPSLLDLVLSLQNGDVGAIKRILSPPNSASAHFAFARFYAEHELPSEALKHFALVDKPLPIAFAELLSVLFEGHHYQAAYQIWLQADGKNYAQNNPQIIDGGFEEDIALNVKWFGWRVSPVTGALEFNLDKTIATAGQSSLMLEFKGIIAPGADLLSQYVPVKAGSQNRLNFSVKTDELLAGGVPVLQIFEARGRNLLAVIELPTGTNDWRKLNVNFKTGSATQAVIISLQRKNCSEGSRCPISGRLWLDEFTLN